ncbi:hypothetical protein [Candidatus Odyssella acanthamoebae]|uniref:Uncharacterized protein n=1 Tax=Candidatus Odyssella acanthamoebae TaxID=91604 RepID=A0A077AQY2_9PROT|nr:hypothetical protein [Candidatus Paracaedibacter acanthamoebae]AIK95587.1 hypothetical protein ID47_00655 [Candidatus Paracaedibacter acanthamoebae]
MLEKIIKNLKEGSAEFAAKKEEGVGVSHISQASAVGEEIWNGCCPHTGRGEEFHPRIDLDTYKELGRNVIKVYSDLVLINEEALKQ